MKESATGTAATPKKHVGLLEQSRYHDEVFTSMPAWIIPYILPAAFQREGRGHVTCSSPNLEPDMNLGKKQVSSVRDIRVPWGPKLV
jgi:hypothetical protein